MEKKDTTVAVGMSGGVDSSLAASLLRNNGYSVVGLTMTIYSGNEAPEKNKEHACYGPGEEDDIRLAKEVCTFLDIPHYIVDLKDEKSFSFKGRFDYVINSGGIKIFPERVERKLLPFIKNRFIIVGIQDEMLGQKVVLIIEGKIDKTFMIENISTNAQLLKYEIPKEVQFLEKFPETENGKIIRHQVVEQLHLTKNQ